MREKFHEEKDKLNSEFQVRARIARKEYADKWLVIESKLRV